MPLIKLNFAKNSERKILILNFQARAFLDSLHNGKCVVTQKNILKLQVVVSRKGEIAVNIERECRVNFLC